jgi:hypothetical protein
VKLRRLRVALVGSRTTMTHSINLTNDALNPKLVPNPSWRSMVRQSFWKVSSMNFISPFSAKHCGSIYLSIYLSIYRSIYVFQNQREVPINKTMAPGILIIFARKFTGSAILGSHQGSQKSEARRRSYTFERACRSIVAETDQVCRVP